MLQGLVVAVEAVASASRIMLSLRSSLPPVILSAILMLAIAADAGAQSASSQGYLLWTRSDSGQAVLWQVDPVSGGLVKSITVGPSTGMGASWKATSIQYAGASAYVLWTRSDTGQAELWTIDPATGSKLKSASLQSEVGIGGPWQATSYYHVSSTEGYVLWSRSAAGRAALWRINPSKLETLSVIPAETTAYLYSVSGVGAPWEATSYHHVSATEGYVLWTRSDIGKANLWQIDPSLPTGPSQLKRSVILYSDSGVGAPWQATSYTHLNATEGYVLWTRSDSGKTTLWQVDPSLPTGQGQLKRSLTLNSASGMSAPWQATSYMHREITGGVILNGSADPTIDIGRDGDFYLNTVTTMLFGPKTADGWGEGTLLMGPVGSQGPSGPQGAKGDQGVKGDTGAAGAKGDLGLSGADGATVLNGTVDPDPAVGKNGDFYLNIATATMFGPKSEGGWGAGVSLVGPKGDKGDQGSIVTGIVVGSFDIVVCTGSNNGFAWLDPTDNYFRICRSTSTATVIPSIGTLNMELVTAHFVFVTSGSWQGNLGGLVGADEKCQSEGSTGNATKNLDTTWVALISSSVASARNKVPLLGPVYSIAGPPVASNQADFWDGSLQNGINANANGVFQTGEVWTGSTEYGFSAADNCTNWTSTSSSAYFGYGNTTTSNWFGTHYVPWSPICDRLFHLYCISSSLISKAVQYSIP